MPLGADLTANGNDRFAMNIAYLTPGLLRGAFGFSVETGNSWRSYDFSTDLFALNSPGTLTIPYSRFPGADMTAVQAIKIDVARFEPSFQIMLNSITTVPEPSLQILFLAGLGALAFASKRGGRA